MTASLPLEAFGGGIPLVEGNLLSSAEFYGVPTLSDSVDLPHVTRQITVGSAGALKVSLIDDTTVVIPANVLAAEPTQTIRAKRIWSTGTTVTPADIFVKY